MSDYTLPPLPLPAAAAFAPRVEAYGHACAEAARAPVIEANSSLSAANAALSARIAELEADAEIGKRWRENSSLEEWFPITAEEIDRLRAEVEAKAGEVEALRSGIDRALARARVFDDGSDGADGESARSCVEILSTLLAQPFTPWVNPLAAEVEALRRLLFHVYTAPGMGYTDDGELQDSTVHPPIDFLRMTPEQIQEAIRRREGKGGRLGELAAEVEKYKADAEIEWEPGRSYTAAELLRRVISNTRPRKGDMLWPSVMKLCGVGSTVAHYLCRWAGRDPDTGKDIAARKGEGSEG